MSIFSDCKKLQHCSVRATLSSRGHHSDTSLFSGCIERFCHARHWCVRFSVGAQIWTLHIEPTIRGQPPSSVKVCSSHTYFHIVLNLQRHSILKGVSLAISSLHNCKLDIELSFPIRRNNSTILHSVLNLPFLNICNCIRNDAVIFN